MWQTVSVNGCHRDGCEPVCCVKLIGTSHQKRCPFPSPSPPLPSLHPCCAGGKRHRPSKLGWALGPFTHSTASPDLQADKTCQTRHGKERQAANTSVFNFVTTFSGEKRVRLAILRQLKLPERQISNIHPLATSTGLDVVVCHLFLRLVLIFSLSSFDS